MDEEHNGLTLEGLAQRLEALERENAELRQEVSALRGSGIRRGEVPALRGSGTRRETGAESPEPDALVSRRSLLSKAGAAAVAAVAAGTFLPSREAKADHLDPSIFVDAVHTHYVIATDDLGRIAINAGTTSDTNSAVAGRNNGAGPGVYGSNAGTGPAIEGLSEGIAGTGVKGTGANGVVGESTRANFYGVTGRNNRTNGTGVRGVGAAQGVLGESTNGIGVKGVGKKGVYGESSTAGEAAVEGRNTGGGHGVGAVGRVGLLAFSHEDGWSGAWGRHTGNGSGVAGDSAKGVGVYGFSNSGYGGQFEVATGGKAQLMLKPGGSAGAPTSGLHRQGEIYMDSRGALFVCTAGDGTTVGTWKKVNTTAV